MRLIASPYASKSASQNLYQPFPHLLLGFSNSINKLPVAAMRLSHFTSRVVVTSVKILVAIKSISLPQYSGLLLTSLTVYPCSLKLHIKSYSPGFFVSNKSIILSLLYLPLNKYEARAEKRKEKELLLHLYIKKTLFH